MNFKIILLTFFTLFLSHKNVAQSVPAYSHIVVVIGENTKASSVLGNSSAPYINSLANGGAKFTNSFAVFHPSQPNYISLFSGSNQGISNDNLITTKFTTANLGNELISAGKTFITYSEDLPSIGFDGKTSAKYARKHNASANWMGTGVNQIPATANQPFTAFPSNFNNLPTVSFVIPNLCNDGHDICAPTSNKTLQYDLWIKNNLNTYKLWCVNNNSLLIVTYDEDDSATTANKIATVFYGAKVAVGTYNQTINHYTVLRTIEEATRLTSHAGAAANATAINYCWQAGSVLKQISGTKFEDKSINNDENISIFPNPIEGDVLNVSGLDKYLEYEIINLQGKILLNGKIYSESIFVGELKKGIYLIRFLNSDKIFTKRFIKN